MLSMLGSVEVSASTGNELQPSKGNALSTSKETQTIIKSLEKTVQRLIDANNPVLTIYFNKIGAEALQKIAQEKSIDFQF